MAAQYGSTGAALARGIEQALLQRQMLARQAMLDELTRKKTEADIAQQDITTKSLADQRAAAKAKQTLDMIEATHPPGAPLSPEDITTLKGVPGGAALIVGAKTAPLPPVVAPEPPAALAAPGLPPAPEAPAAPAPGAVPEALKAEPSITPPSFAGTSKQQDVLAKKDALQKIINDPNTDPAVRTWAQGELGGVSIPAGIAVPKSASETAAEHQQRIEALYAKRYNGAKLTPEENAEIKANEEFRTKPAVTNFNMNQPFKEDKATSQYYASQQAAVDRIRTPIAQQMERAVRALDSLENPSMVSDAVVAPEFLTVIAGGFGTGLRMSEAELSRINMSQNRWDQLRAEFNKWRTGSEPVIQPAMREEMKKILTLAMNRAEKKLSLYDDYLAQMAKATSTDEIKELAAKMRKDDTKLTSGDPNAYGFGPEAKGGKDHKKTAEELIQEYGNPPAGGKK